MDFINSLVAFNLGLLSTLHCLGMCGGIIGALSIGQGYGTVASGKQNSWFVIAYNVGRITSYSVAGAICGFVGQQVVDAAIPDYGHRILQFFAAAVLVMIGMHLAGWLTRFRNLESIGIRFWKLIQPAGRRFMPVRNIGQAIAVGMVWGWLPCALVYSVLLWAVTSGGALEGALIMFAFGLGTLPGMIAAGMLGSRLISILKDNKLRQWAGVIIIFFGIATLFIHAPQHDNHDLHFNHSTEMEN